jgi:hypothetical protein
MKKLLFALPVLFSAIPAQANDMMVYINVNRFCAAVVNIPYASDNFSDEEWQKFQNCVKYVRRFNGIQ